MRRELYLVRRFARGSVKPYFDDATFCGASLLDKANKYFEQVARNLAASRAAECADRNAGADAGAIGETVSLYQTADVIRGQW